MSTYYRPLKDLSYKDMKKKCTDIEFVKNENASNKWGEIIHSDGNWLHFYEFDDKVVSFARYGQNYVEGMIEHIAFTMLTPIFDEYSQAYEVLSLQDMDEEERAEFLAENGNG